MRVFRAAVRWSGELGGLGKRPGSEGEACRRAGCRAWRGHGRCTQPTAGDQQWGRGAGGNKATEMVSVKYQHI